jgi:hypothetical protein
VDALLPALSRLGQLQGLVDMYWIKLCPVKRSDPFLSGPYRYVEGERYQDRAISGKTRE